MPHRTSTAQNTLVQATIFKKCDRTYHKPDSNKGCAGGTCQHTCEPGQVPAAPQVDRPLLSQFPAARAVLRHADRGADLPAHPVDRQADPGRDVHRPPRRHRGFPAAVRRLHRREWPRPAPRARPPTAATSPTRPSRRLLKGKSVLDVARMDAEVKTLLNMTLGGYSDEYRGNIRRIITGTLDECVRRGIIPRHTLTGIELAPRIVTAEQYEQQDKGMVAVSDETVRMLADGITVAARTRRPHAHRVMPGAGHRPVAAAHDGTADQGGPGSAQVRLPAARRRYPLPAPVLAGQRERPGTGTAQAPQGRRLPRRPRARHDLGHGPRLPDGPLCPGPNGTPTCLTTPPTPAGQPERHLGISGVRDEIDVAVALREDEQPVILPIEAKAVADPINRVQISAQVKFCHYYFPGHEVRPLAIKVDYDSLIHLLEFNATEIAADLKIQMSATYRLNLSAQQLELIRRTEQRLL